MPKSKKTLLPSERFKRIFTNLETFAEIVGFNVMRENYHFTWVSYFTLIFIACYFTFTFYTVYLGVVIQKNWLVLMQSLTITGTALQGTAKLVSAVWHATTLRDLRKEIDKIYLKYERQSEEYNNQLLKAFISLKHTTILLMLISGFGMGGLICVPLYRWYIFNEKVLMIYFLVPHIDPDTDIGYLFYIAIHGVSLILGFVGNFVSDILLLCLIIHVPLLKDILKCRFNDLDEILEQHPRNAAKSSALVRDIFQVHQKYLDFSVAVKDCFFWVIFVQIGTVASSIIGTIICQFLGVMPSASVFLIYSFFILYTYSGIGNLVEISNDDVTTHIYECKWYLLVVPQQKMILLMLRRSQETQGMSIGGVSPLSLNAALQVTKFIYSVTMMLNRFFNK